MEDHKTTQKTSIIHPSSPLPQTSDNDHDPPPPATAEDGDTPTEEDPVKTPEPRKRKGCPSALDKCEALIKKKNPHMNSNYSFTFDTKFCAGSGFSGTPESTPKFGSFNLVEKTVIRREEKDGEGGNRDLVELEQTKSGVESSKCEGKKENDDF